MGLPVRRLLPAVIAWVLTCVACAELRPGIPYGVGAGPPIGAQPRVGKGTCFAAGPQGQLVTAHHVIRDAPALRVVLSDGSVHRPRVVAVSAPTDIAVLQVEVPTPRYLTPAEPGTVRLGERVFAMGYPAVDVLGSDPKFSEGVVNSLSGPGGDATFLQTSVPLHPGSSGGPLVTETGALAGIAVATADAERFFQATGALPQNVNWAIKADYVAAALGARFPSVRSPGRREAIRLTRDALCLVVTQSEGS